MQLHVQAGARMRGKINLLVWVVAVHGHVVVAVHGQVVQSRGDTSGRGAEADVRLNVHGKGIQIKAVELIIALQMHNAFAIVRQDLGSGGGSGDRGGEGGHGA